MCKKEYKAEDFVLDPDFQKWVLHPDSASKSYWNTFLKNNPEKYQEILLARKLVMNMSRKSMDVGEERLDQTWGNIEQALNNIKVADRDKKVIPLDSSSTLKKYGHRNPIVYKKSMPFYRWVGILVVAFSFAIVANLFFPQPVPQVAELPLIYEEHDAPPGVKSNLTLQDGSRVILNSGSTLRYIKNFEAHQRILELEGEAYFEVAKDPQRPFKVITGPVTTQAIGTSFNIRAYKDESLDISLLTGLVAVQVNMDESRELNLEKGEGLQIDLEKQEVLRVDFDEALLLAWTRKTIVFNQAPMPEVTRVLENWYGVKVQYTNRPSRNLEVSGTFQDQTLKNVLEGLSYSARFDFTINKDEVVLTFK